MKICILADAGSIHTQRWARFFAAKNYDVHLISLRTADIENVTFYPIKTTIPIITGHAVSTLLKFGYFFYIREIKKIIHHIKPDILHAHWASTYGLIGAYSGYKPFILSVWGSDIFNFPRKSPFHRKIIKYALHRADYITATSRVLTRETGRYLDEKKIIYTIPFGVDIKKFKPKDKKPSKYITIGIVKTLEKKYGIKYLIRAFSHLAKSNNKLRLLIIGHGTQEQDLKRLCCDLSIQQKVRFTGYINNDKVPDYLNEIDIFVVPSIVPEAFGVSVIEASACELPVIASAIGGLPEVVKDGETGFLFEPKNSDELIQKLDQLICSPDLRKRMGKKGRKLVEKYYIWDENCSYMEKLYKNIFDN